MVRIDFITIKVNVVERVVEVPQIVNAVDFIGEIIKLFVVLAGFNDVVNSYMGKVTLDRAVTRVLVNLQVVEVSTTLV